MKTYPLSQYSTLIIMLVSMMFSGYGCMPVALGAGEVQALQSGTTLWLINEALLGRPLTFMMGKGDMVLIASFMKDVEAYGFVALDTTKVSLENAKKYVCPNGQVCAYGTLYQLVTELKKYGWQRIETWQLPKELIIAVDTAVAGTTTFFSAGASWVSTSLPTILAIPIIGTEEDFMQSIIDPSGMYNYSEE